MSQTPDLTDEQRANLTTLAAYLRTLPAEYPAFSMDNYTADDSRIAAKPECGTAACAAGHGINAGVPALDGETWFKYSERAFASDDICYVGFSAWDWCFAASWARSDNTAHGAADRISYMLEHGIPDDAEDQIESRSAQTYHAPVTAA